MQKSLIIKTVLPTEVSCDIITYVRDYSKYENR